MCSIVLQELYKSCDCKILPLEKLAILAVTIGEGNLRISK
jgi:hypothetical protein